MRRAVHRRHPTFWRAVVADAKIAQLYRGERQHFRNRLDAMVQVVRLCVVTDAFLAQCCYRAKARCRALGVPALPPLLHRAAIVLGQISIGDPVIVQPGVYIPHGQVVIDGFTEIKGGTILFPFVNLGLAEGQYRGPQVGPHALVGTGAKIVGDVRIGANAKVGANAVVLADVPDGATAVGIPARIVSG